MKLFLAEEAALPPRLKGGNEMKATNLFERHIVIRDSKRRPVVTAAFVYDPETKQCGFGITVASPSEKKIVKRVGHDKATGFAVKALVNKQNFYPFKRAKEVAVKHYNITLDVDYHAKFFKSLDEAKKDPSEIISKLAKIVEKYVK